MALSSVLKAMAARTHQDFYFIPAATVLSSEEKGLPRMQTLRDQGYLRKMAVDLAAAFRGEGLINKILFVSHRWEDPGAPDSLCTQLEALQGHLRVNPDIELVWYDYSALHSLTHSHSQATLLY